MSQTGTSAWWTEVQHLRDAAARTDEARRRADQADLAARRASRERRSVEAEVASAPARRRVESEVARTPAPASAQARRRVESEAAPAPAEAFARPGRFERDAAPQRRAEPDASAPTRRFEPETPAAPSRRREHADQSGAPRRLDGPVARRGGYDAVAIPGRRTIEIRGRTVPAPAVPRSLELDRTRRPPRRDLDHVGPRPDRMAMWALLMGLVLIAVAITTASPT
jgi:hypothetical protein